MVHQTFDSRFPTNPHPKTTNRILLCLVVCIAGASLGCVAPGVRLSAIKWNLDNSLGRPADAHSPSLELAGKSFTELRHLMATKPSPCAQELDGTWYGVNKGYGAAWLGIHQDVKVFRASECGVTGYNILVKQVTVKDLPCHGWMPQRNPISCEPRTMGNFVVVNRCEESSIPKNKLVLDYSLASNKRLDPSKLLVDELVVVEPGLMLGRVRITIGPIELPIAYFVLSRQKAPSSCDDASL